MTRFLRKKRSLKTESTNSLEGYEELTLDGGQTLVIVATAHRQCVLDLGLHDPAALLAQASIKAWATGGRAPHPVIGVGDDVWVIKSYRRGGIVGKFNEDFYFGSMRFLSELRVCTHAIREGVPTVAPIALVLRRHGLGCRAWLVSPFLAETYTLKDALLRPEETLDSEHPEKALSALSRVAGTAVRRMHDVGIDHRDLNLGNLLVLPPAPDSEPEVLILDWDRARLQNHDAAFGYQNLLRLLRSAFKGRAETRFLSVATRGFLRGYFSGDVESLHRLRQYYGQRRFTAIGLHRLFWRE